MLTSHQLWSRARNEALITHFQSYMFCNKFDTIKVSEHSFDENCKISPTGTKFAGCTVGVEKPVPQVYCGCRETCALVYMTYGTGRFTTVKYFIIESEPNVSLRTSFFLFFLFFFDFAW